MEAELAERALRAARSRGLEEAEAAAVAVDYVAVEIAGHRVKSVSAASRVVLGLRAARQGRVAGVTVEDPSADLDRVAADLERLVSSSPRDPGWPGFPPPLRPRLAVELGPRWSEGSEAEVALAMAEASLAGAEEGGRASGAQKAEVVSGRVVVGVSRLFVANTNGLEASEECGFSHAYGTVKAAFAEGESSFDFEVANRRGEPREAGERAREAAELAGLFLRPSVPESGVYELVLAPRVLAELLEASLVPALSGLNIAEGRSPLRGKLGQLVLSEAVTIVDDPTLPLELGTRGVDDEGVGTTKKALVERGVFARPLTNYYSAKRLGLDDTGNGFRAAPGQATAPGPTNVVVAPGSGSLEEFARELRRGIVVYGTIGHWMSSFASGSVSATVTHGVLVEGGRAVGAVKSAVVSGNIYEWLGGGLAGLGADSAPHGGYVVPSAMISGARVSGK